MHKITSSRVIKLLKKHGVQAVYLFGSQTDKTAHPGSDYDFGFLFKKGYPKDKDLAYADFEEIFAKEVAGKGSKADIVFLHQAPIALQFRAINQSKMIYVDNYNKATDYEEQTALRYLDFKPILRMFTEETIKRHSLQNYGA
ncbi:nucleotidyltransferase domain-containing protein [Patescibacteria group bacterium]|nr:nucleotidyltransferase domain-containing protein [Patescibacteria group bacterium]MBU4512359.1 nucleotidyltransferase domain-containing protein [Patescibacteria group bacterium]MCG2692785.1 nucleotidyltransferase domain-containing protein [Candidatus Parcubacteria bacterium]